MAGSLIARAEAFVAREWPSSDLQNGYSEVNVRGRLWRRLCVPGDIQTRLAARKKLFAEMFRGAARLWLLAGHRDPSVIVSGDARVDSREQWANPDWDQHYKYTLWVVECTFDQVDCEQALNLALRGQEPFQYAIDPDRKIGFEHGFSNVDAFLHASTQDEVDRVEAAMPDGKWSG